MGSFGEYSGAYQIPEEKRELFSEQMIKILNYGGMMEFDAVSMYGHELGLLKPVHCYPGGEINFHYNYFEDEPWESAGYDSHNTYLWSYKIGSDEFADVILAGYMLYEMYNEKFGLTLYDEDVLSATGYVGWMNHLLGTEFSMKKRFRLWDNMQEIVFGLLENEQDFDSVDFRNMIPQGLEYAAGGTEFADLMYIKEGTGDLTENEVKAGTYPADILQCKRALEMFLGADRDENAVEAVYELLKKEKEEREQTEDERLKMVAEYSLVLPARVLAYLTAELTGRRFWEDWKEIYNKAYHDEVMKKYVSDEQEAWRRKKQQEPISPVRTSDFLYEKDPFPMAVPSEAKGEPDYVLSDDDRLFWWDGTDEVILSDNMDEWLKELAERHRNIMEENSDSWIGTSYPMKDFLMLFVEADQFYKRLFPFQTMFYEFQEQCSQIEYRAALELFRQLIEENREKGKLIEYARSSWDITNRKITKNTGRLKLKRYLSVMANRKLREKYFGF